MDRNEYVEEIKLIQEQNDVEFELYPMAVDIIKPTLKNLSKRYVFARRKTDRGQIYYGVSSFPDVAILDNEFKNTPNTCISKEEWLKLKGCVEVKALSSRLISKEEIERVILEKPETLEKDMGQLIGEVLWYKRVIYTNGIKWRFIYIKNYSEKLSCALIDAANERIKYDEKIKNNEEESSITEYNWWEKVKSVKFEIVDECISDNCIINWDDFISNIQKINWE